MKNILKNLKSIRDNIAQYTEPISLLSFSIEYMLILQIENTGSFPPGLITRGDEADKCISHSNLENSNQCYNWAKNKVCKRRGEGTINFIYRSLYRLHCTYTIELAIEGWLDIFWNHPAFNEHFFTYYP